MEVMPTLSLPKHDEELISELVEGHRRIESQPLRLALAYRPADRRDDLVLFEVTQGFGGGRVSHDRDLLKVWVAPSPNFRLEGVNDFYLLLTNPDEFGEALAGKWPQIDDIKRGIDAGESTLLYADAQGEAMWKRLGGQ